MKTLLAVTAVALSVSACATTPTPLSAQQTREAIAVRTVARTCFANRQLQYPQHVVSLLTATERQLAQRGDPVQINAITRELANETVQVGHCREVDLLALQRAQKLAEHEQKQAANQQALENFNQSMQAMQRNIAQQQPRSVTCQHYQWGNMTTCNAY